MRHLPSLAALRAFEAAARRQSFKLAAAELGVTPTAISHQVKLLETELGLRLFTRRPREVALTSEGRSLFLDLRRAFDAIADAIRARGGGERGGGERGGGERRQTATLAAPASFAARRIVPRVAAFRARCPGWELRLQICDDGADIGAGAADAAIGHSAGGDGAGLAALPLYVDRFAPVCSPRVDVRRPRHLATATLIHCASSPSWRRWLEQRGKGRLDPDAGLAFGDPDSAIRAAVAGRGVALASLTLAAPELESGALIQPFGPMLEGPRYDFVAPLGGEERPEVAVLRDWVVAEFADETAAFSAAAQKPKG
ncbi:LysR substrate-binding domain-containing protein [Methylosinus sp. Sm6]|uniref:LysR substrate-binding domain-containing protein n=1 Tax=Methylosinus sp. Sm6 TaxID=2866948 RepID=UPI001C99DC28|nr:LysR substrate-binding domain-containing protein [Methylosinus sp. Sm6]MBY6240959.1 LysR family transcriptional regulator [Methylosinus sp. Sm6]